MATEQRKREFIMFTLVGRYLGGSEPCCNGLEYLAHKSPNKKATGGPRSALIVVAIDFGTTFSGYSFAFTKDKFQVRYMPINKGLESIHKVPYLNGKLPHQMNLTDAHRSALLFNQHKEFCSFGYEAQSRFHELDSRQSRKWHYFENFKMTLHQNQGLDRDFKVRSITGASRISASTVFMSALKHLFRQAMQEISDQLAFELSKKDICWVLTVPAIWNDSAKQFMRQVAIETGLVDPEMLHIALESEVASLYCGHVMGKQASLETDASTYAIIDAGGGSVDVTFHQVLPSGGLREVHKSSGMQCGSFEINKAFEQLLARFLGTELWSQFKENCPFAYLDLMHKFELRKREASLERKNPYNIALQHNFVQFFASKNVSIEAKFKEPACPKGLKYSSKLGVIRIEVDLMRQFFDSVIERIKRHIKGEVNCLLEKMNVARVFLVGGFAQSPLLQEQLKRVLEPESSLLVPPSPQLAVLHGAALFGLEPAVIEARRAMRTYGVAVMERANSKRGTWRLGLFDRFVTANQSIGLCEAITRRYRPIFQDQMPNQTQLVKLEFYSTERERVNFVTEPHVSKCGTIYLQLEPIKQKGTLNPAFNQLIQREIEVQMFFGETEIKALVTDLYTGKTVKANVDFWDKA